jgi:hypothetical protein
MKLLYRSCVLVLSELVISAFFVPLLLEALASLKTDWPEHRKCVCMCMSLVLNCKTRTQPFVYVNTLFFFCRCGSAATQKLVVLEVPTLLIESVQPLAVLTNEAVVTELWPSAESDCVTEDGWVIFCEILKFLLSGVDTDTEHEFRADRRSSVA